ncbi:hypothetical protein M3Y99_01281300 [Aphelenchoides fujianensis]|nr:hypothetical protein M3Y99_01281300 [Aphelenchoides fujianensis]
MAADRGRVPPTATCLSDSRMARTKWTPRKRPRAADPPEAAEASRPSKAGRKEPDERSRGLHAKEESETKDLEQTEERQEEKAEDNDTVDRTAEGVNGQPEKPSAETRDER